MCSVGTGLGCDLAAKVGQGQVGGEFGAKVLTVVESAAIKANRSIPAATVIPVLTYLDVRHAVAWLSVAFGFVERVRIGEDHRAQLGFGDGALIVADVRGNRELTRLPEKGHGNRPS